jgi:pimeloyl-ACP methyl ester carboxylesterase
VRESRNRQTSAIVGLAIAGAVLLGLGEAASPARGLPAPEEPGRRLTLARPGEPPLALYYEEYGSGPPVLLLHGLGESIFTWRDILPALAARHRVIALDLKGFGRSDKPDDGAYSADDQAALVARFIVERNLSGLTVVGHSFGGTVALRAALAEPIAGKGRIRRIVAIAAPALPRATARHLDLVMTPLVPDTVAAVLPPEDAARFLLKEAMGGRTPSEKTVEGYAAPYREHDAMRAFLATARSIVNERDTEAIAKRYKALKQPVLLVWCRKDPIVPLRAGRQLASALPRARLAVLEGCHHLPQHERPKQLLRVLGPFLDG